MIFWFCSETTQELTNNEPLPPGVDPLEIEIPVTKVIKNTHFLFATKKLICTFFQADHLNSALSSFYSEMATISTATPASETVITEDNSAKLVENVGDKVKKKKKTKVSDKFFCCCGFNCVCFR